MNIFLLFHELQIRPSQTVTGHPCANCTGTPSELWIQVIEDKMAWLKIDV